MGAFTVTKKDKETIKLMSLTARLLLALGALGVLALAALLIQDLVILAGIWVQTNTISPDTLMFMLMGAIYIKVRIAYFAYKMFIGSVD